MRLRKSLRHAAATALLAAGIAAPPAAAAPPGPAVPAAVGLDRHIAGLLGRLGCNAGSCHGAANGKGGLKLSLFGADPARDYEALVGGGRVNPDAPEDSLLARKPTGPVGHGGGRRIEPGSWEHRVLLRWVEQGTKRGPGTAVRRLTLTPGEVKLAGPGDKAQVRATAEFADGSREDVTGFSTFRSGDEDVAGVDAAGGVRGRRPGFTTVVVGYGGTWAPAVVLVPRPVAAGVRYPDGPADHPIDRLVRARLRTLDVVPSPPCSDAEFLRRVTIDVSGSLPTPDEVRAFLADPDAGKRAKKVDELLAGPRHAALWATRFLDWTGCDVDALEEPADLRPARARVWHAWFRQRLADNTPYDRVVRGVLCGTTRGGNELAGWMDEEADRLGTLRERGTDPGYAGRPFLDLYWRRLDGNGPVPPERMAELTAAAFLGVRLQCAQCHRHPADRWTQADYRAFANAFAPVRFGQSAALRDAVVDRLEAGRVRGAAARPLPRLGEVYVEAGTDRSLPDPVTGKALAARALGGPTLGGADPREALADWMTSPRNPYFARNLANRVWQHYFGRGLVDPVDDFSDARPPAVPELLDLLAREFVEGGYDIRRLERLVLTSRTYQLSAAANDTNTEDESGLARFRPRRPMAEVAVDLIHDACGAEADYAPDAPRGARATEVATSRPRNPFLRRVAAAFGRPDRRQVCDCGRRSDPVLAESLLLMTDPDVLRLTARGRVARLVADGVPDTRAVEELFLAALSRPPGAAELRDSLAYVAGKADRRTGLEGLLWALINTREFILIH
ncbi:DUF1553 domain-containing protein [bacterium]|nr:DUF1553 domain-containing protein [bacterium]